MLRSTGEILLLLHRRGSSTPVVALMRPLRLILTTILLPEEIPRYCDLSSALPLTGDETRQYSTEKCHCAKKACASSMKRAHCYSNYAQARTRNISTPSTFVSIVIPTSRQGSYSNMTQTGTCWTLSFHFQNKTFFNISMHFSRLF